MKNALLPLAGDLNTYAFLLDVDGTLLDIAPTPRSVWVPPQLLETLAALLHRTGGAVAFVSGRRVSELDLLFAPLQLSAIGGHGAELRLAANTSDDPTRVLPLDSNLKRQLAKLAHAHQGVLVEDKGYSLALHYRLAPKYEPAIRQAVVAICATVPTMPVDILVGRSMIEIKQAGFNKGTAVRELMTCPPFRGRRPIFLGDDITDLDVFAVMPDFNGVAISVGGAVQGADLVFDGPEAVRDWLDQLVHSKLIAAS